MKRKLFFVVLTIIAILLAFRAFKVFFPPEGTVEEFIGDNEYFALFNADNIKEIRYKDEVLTDRETIEEIIARLKATEVKKLYRKKYGTIISEYGIQFLTKNGEIIEDFIIHIEEGSNSRFGLYGFHSGKGKAEAVIYTGFTFEAVNDISQNSILKGN